MFPAASYDLPVRRPFSVLALYVLSRSFIEMTTRNNASWPQLETGIITRNAETKKFACHEYANFQVIEFIEPDFFPDLHSAFVQLTVKKSKEFLNVNNSFHLNSKSLTENKFLPKLLTLNSFRIKMKYCGKKCTNQCRRPLHF